MNTYEKENGEVLELPEIETVKDKEKCFKISLPSSEDDFINASGEGIWACATDEGFKAWDENGEGEYFVKILNDSMYYLGLNRGTVLPVEFRKGQRPVAYYEDLVHQYGTCRREEVTRFLENGIKES